MKPSVRLATALMRWGSRHRKFGHQDCYTREFVQRTRDGVSIATQREFDDGASFFLPLKGLFSAKDLNGKDVLDLGCGHGGRTAYYFIHGSPASITGIEISVERLRTARDSVRKIADSEKIMFAVAVGERMPFVEASFDLVISYDVFEHVQNLAEVLKECHRVLRPGGRLVAVFPPYYGPRTHHLDFITTIPFLHHVFSPGTLVRAANRVLEEQPELRDETLPEPQVSYLGRTVLPRLNGTTVKDFRRLVRVSPFKVVDFTILPFAWGPGGAAKRAVSTFCRAALKVPWPFTPDIFAGTIRCVLEKADEKSVRD